MAYSGIATVMLECVIRPIMRAGGVGAVGQAPSSAASAEHILTQGVTVQTARHRDLSAVDKDASVFPPLTVGAERLDERGNVVQSPSATVSHATHIGPHRADKLENQDATFATVGSRGEVIFTVADGVSTSFGARYAAAAAGEYFCKALASRLAEGGLVSREMISDTLRRTQAFLEQQAKGLAMAEESAIWDVVRGASNLSRESVVRMIEKTLTDQGFKYPVLATTLMGGVAHRDCQTRNWVVQIFRVGDGWAEVSCAHGIEVLLNMDQERTHLSSVLCPGPLGSACVDGFEYVSRECGPDDYLLLSTDGLLRGPASGTLHGILMDVSSVFASGNGPKNPLGVLNDAATHEDQQQAGLFRDNLGIAFVTVPQLLLPTCL